MARELKKILFLGLGGAGQRHLRIFRSLLPEAHMFAWRRVRKTPVLQPDFMVAEGATLEERYNLEVFSEIEEAFAQSPDLVVIALPSAMQADAVVDAAQRGCNVFVEKPGSINLQQSMAINEAIRTNKVDYFVSFQRRFHPLVQRMKSVIESEALGPLMSVCVKVASYVPAWHPYEDFRDLYACRADLGGGVLRTESHELDLLGWLFGQPQSVQGILACRGAYSLDVEDSADIILDYGSFTAQVNLCFMQQHQQRVVEINGRDGWLKCDLNEQRLLIGHHVDGNIEDYTDDSVGMDAMFKAQAEYFMNDFENGDSEYMNAVNGLMTLINEVEGHHE